MQWGRSDIDISQLDTGLDVAMPVTSPKESITAAIPSSFVKRHLKLIEDTGNGEAKLYIGRTQDLGDYEDFFGGWGSSNIYRFDVGNLLDYMDGVRGEFQKHTKYKDVSLGMWQESLEEIREWRHGWEIDLRPYHDKYRVYIRSRSVAWTLMREIAVPVISELEIRRGSDEEGRRVYLLFLTVGGETGGEKVKSVSVLIKEKRKWCREKYGPRWFDVARTEKSRRLREAHDALANGLGHNGDEDVNNGGIRSGSGSSSSDTASGLSSSDGRDDSDEGSDFDIPGLFD
tara:strand:+ start:393 stop:1253 length:861 start_codon:yes stop_codon:yes gene_type:complete